MSDERDLKSHQIMELTRAIERVTALADELEGYTQRRGRPAPGSYDYVANLAQADAAARIRAAIAGPQ